MASFGKDFSWSRRVLTCFDMAYILGAEKDRTLSPPLSSRGRVAAKRLWSKSLITEATSKRVSHGNRERKESALFSFETRGFSNQDSVFFRWLRMFCFPNSSFFLKSFSLKTPSERSPKNDEETKKRQKNQKRPLCYIEFPGMGIISLKGIGDKEKICVSRGAQKIQRVNCLPPLTVKRVNRFRNLRKSRTIVFA